MALQMDKLIALSQIVIYNLQVKEIKAQACYDSDNMPTDALPDICPLDIQDGTNAWMDEYLQQQLNSNNHVYGKGTSIIKEKKTLTYCTNVASFMQNLRPGRTCKYDQQCKSRDCNEKQCRGLIQNSFCNSHDDCAAGLYCRDSINWPYESKCSAQRGQSKNQFQIILLRQYETCTTDYECQNSLFCWYASSTDRKLNQTKCLPMYSQPINTIFGWSTTDRNISRTLELIIDDFELNGKYCQSGLAHPVDVYTARCAVASSVYGYPINSTTGSTLVKPYVCDPTDVNKKCKIIIDTTGLNSTQLQYASQGKRGYVEVFCKCSLAGGSQSNVGFCGSVIGTDDYTNAVASLLNVLQKSKCHTLDRDDLRSQKDPCGIGTKNEEWRFAVEKMFNVTYWQYIQVGSVYSCIYKIFGDSWYNLNLNTAYLLSTSVVIFSVVFGMVSYGSWI
ncbi:UNKNOWN [Stylonychia lemnae]|uniref:Dickkopf N-terminal cysteine-rich domain-containing protein n=1 Tax=Stylonychia lemnae TaxID=5949 RepID=A0A078ATK3_STYLE|nr:UNKNOWN [Stylonychia lemnae]|eukprot:CDW84527.1 UNKNOWN [Stylonychia lemnae]